MDTKKLILEKSLKLMIEKQNSIISIREISDATGITIGGIYHYFSNKEEIYNEITEKYFINYIKFDIDNLMQIKGNAKEKIHDIMVEILKQKETGIKIESIDYEIDYREILLILTAKGFTYENSLEHYQITLNELKDFLTQIIEEGQKNKQIRQDFKTEDITYLLITMYMGIQYKWEIYLIDDMISTFENIYEIEWEMIKSK